MRTKKVEKAIEETKKWRDFYRLREKTHHDFCFSILEKDIPMEEIETVLNYISELEEIVNSIDTQFIHKDKVFELTDELNKQVDVYNVAVDKFNTLLGKRTRK